LELQTAVRGLREEEDQLAVAIPGARVVVYPATGHSPNWERPERVAADLDAFIWARGSRPPASGPSAWRISRRIVDRECAKVPERFRGCKADPRELGEEVLGLLEIATASRRWCS
jgi:hypothetical protein